MALVQAGQAALPPDMAFPAEVELAIGTGAIFDGMEPLPEAAFDLPLDLPSEPRPCDASPCTRSGLSHPWSTLLQEQRQSAGST